MNAEDALRAVDETAFVGDVAPRWEESQRALAGERVPFLSAEAIVAERAYCGLDAELDAWLVQLARRIEERPALAQLAWHCQWRLFDAEETPFGDWPPLQHALGADRGGFYLLVALSWAPRLRAWHERLGLPAAVTRDTARKLSEYVDSYERTGDGVGVHRFEIWWLQVYLHKAYVRLGRLEFVAEPYYREAIVFRHRVDRRVIVLAAPDVPFDEHGCVADKATSAWLSTFTEDEHVFRGQRIDPRGFAVAGDVLLPRDAWRCVVRQGTPTLSIHIPAGGGMTLDACRDAMRAAAAFFPRHVPGTEPVAFVCNSWTLDRQFEDLLPSDANLVRFQREVHLLPARRCGPFRGLWQVFHTVETRPELLPRRTRLQRAIADHLARGGVISAGGMVFLVDDLDEFGRQPYLCRADDPDAGA